MSEEDNNKLEETAGTLEDGMDRIPIDDPLDNDNAFSDKGLHNARVHREAMKKGNR